MVPYVAVVTELRPPESNRAISSQIPNCFINIPGFPFPFPIAIAFPHPVIIKTGIGKSNAAEER